MGRTWQVEIDGTVHRVEGDYKALFNTGRGSISVDGRVVDAWGAAWFGQPRERRFEVVGRPAILRKSGLIFEDYELFVDGKLVPHQR
ncbi:MAG: hypothetical protein ABSE58_12825 [Candidatus Limnocylindrales bacterium]